MKGKNKREIEGNTDRQIKRERGGEREKKW